MQTNRSKAQQVQAMIKYIDEPASLGGPAPDSRERLMPNKN